MTLVDNRHVDPSLTFERPRPAPVACPKIDELLAKAAEAEASADASKAEVEYLKNQARAIGNEISRLRLKRREAEQRLQNLEMHDVPKQRAEAEAIVNRLLGMPGLDPIQENNVNNALRLLPSLREKERLLPDIVKTAKKELEAITKELGKLEAAAK
jgi:seryl-tRNA synthetase